MTQQTTGEAETVPLLLEAAASLEAAAKALRSTAEHSVRSLGAANTAEHLIKEAGLYIRRWRRSQK